MSYYRDDDEFNREEAYRQEMRALRKELDGYPSEPTRDECEWGWLCPYCGKTWNDNYPTSPSCCGEVHCERVEIKHEDEPEHF